MRRLLFLAACLLLPSAARADNPVVRFSVPFVGFFDVELCQETSDHCLGAAPNTVANFLGYLDAGAYGPGSFIHRSVTYLDKNNDVTFSVVQGGSFYVHVVDTLGWDCVVPYECGVAGSTPPPVLHNEFNQSNVRGTMSVPLQSSANATTACDTLPDSGSSGWFINVSDADASIDCGKFTVFGIVLGNGMGVVDRIADLPYVCFDDGTGSCDPVFSSVPLVNYPNPCGGTGQPTCPDLSNPFPYLVYYSVPEPRAAAGAIAALVAIVALVRWRRR
jgi:peptidyl-prolyl cis-trans isomerase A (cyclophilin A)